MSTPSGSADRAIGWPLLIVLASLAATAPLATDLYLPGFPEMSTALDSGASGIQLTLTSFLVGMALGQLVTGPLSDRVGRRGPLVVSGVVAVVAGVVCAVAPSLTVLVSARFVQGLAGAGGMVIARAVISDLVTGRAAAKAFTLMITIGGVAPVLAPLAGGLLIGPAGWRGLLWTVALLGAATLVGIVVVVRETHPPEARSASSFMGGLRLVLGCRPYWAPVAVFALSFGVMMSYISASPFVYQDVIGLSEVGYGVVFGLNAAGLIGAGWIASRVVDRVEPVRMVRVGVVVLVTSCAALLMLALVAGPPWLLMLPIFAAVSANGAIMGNSAALAMAHVRQAAGTGSAVLGFCQFTLGAVVSPLVGLGGRSSAVVPALVMTACALGALVVAATGLSARAPQPYAGRPAEPTTRQGSAR